MHILIAAIGIAVLVTELMPRSSQELAMLVLYIAVYLAYMLLIAICCYALRPAYGRFIHFLGGGAALFAVSWIWTFHSGNLLPASPVTASLAAAHAVIFGVFVHPTSRRIVGLRDNWYRAAVYAHAQVDQGRMRFRLTFLLVALFMMPFIVDLLHSSALSSGG